MRLRLARRGADLRVFNRKLSAAEIDLIYSPVATKLRSEPPAAV